MQLRENKWYCRIDCKTYLKAIMLILLVAILTATLLILFVKTNKQPIGEIYTEEGEYLSLSIVQSISLILTSKIIVHREIILRYI